MILQRLGMPIYLQVKNYILEKIKAGDFRPGAKLPTERDLASELGISRNTVSAAYKELLLEGVLEARQGRGTFVANRPDADGVKQEVSGSRRERVLKIIDSAMEKSLEMGFTLDQFAAFVRIRAQEKATAVRQLRVAVVGCAIEYINRFISQIKQVAYVQFEPVVLSDLQKGQVTVELLQACDLIVAASEHHTTITGLMGGGSNKLIDVSAVPNLEAVVKLARLPVNTAVGVVAVSEKYVDNLKKLLTKTAIGGLNFYATISDNREELHRFVTEYPVLVVAEERLHLVRQLSNDAQEIIVFCYEIDQGSLNQLIAKLVSATL